jgi:hypothetical protein
MHFNVDATPGEIPALLRRFTEIGGAAAWKKRQTDFERQIHDNPMIDRYLDNYFPLERAVIYVRQHNRNTGGWIPQINSTPLFDLGALYSFITLTARVFPRLPKRAQHVLKSRIAGALKDNVGLSPFAFEMRTVAHLMASGFEVEFHDLCEGGGYDFLAKAGDIAFEVECKSVSGDLGHRVHTHRQYQLIPYILNNMHKAEKSGVVQLLVATVPNRLHGNQEFMKSVAAAIGEALETTADVADSEACTVSYREFPVFGSPFDCETPPQISEDDVRDYCNRMIGDEVGHTIMTFSPRQSGTIIAVRSLQTNYPLKAVYHELKEATRQLSGSRPGMICVQFRNMTSAELRDLAATPGESGKPTGIQLMTAKFYDSTARDHVHTIAYVAPGRFRQHQSLTLDTEGLMRTTRFSEDASSYVFTNKKHPDFNDQRYSIFK